MSILYSLLVTAYIFICLLLVLLVLIQKGKGSMGLGAFGGGTQMLFGGSGGQDLFQKITWGLGAIFLIGSLTLALMKSSQVTTSQYINQSDRTEQTIPEL
jgi:preprotein translocase subunit SecG